MPLPNSGSPTDPISSDSGQFPGLLRDGLNELHTVQQLQSARLLNLEESLKFVTAQVQELAKTQQELRFEQRNDRARWARVEQLLMGLAGAIVAAIGAYFFNKVSGG